jgi:hypothetical protein
MSDVGLDAANDKRVAGIAGLAKASPESRQFAWVADGRAGTCARVSKRRVSILGSVCRTMSFEVSGLVHRQTSFAVHGSDEVCLSLSRRHSDAWRSAILTEPRAADDTTDGIAVFQSLVKSLHHHCGNTVTSRIAIGAVIETVTPPIRRQKAHGGQVSHVARVSDQIHTTGDCDFGLACP